MRVTFFLLIFLFVVIGNFLEGGKSAALFYFDSDKEVSSFFLEVLKNQEAGLLRNLLDNDPALAKLKICLDNTPLDFAVGYGENINVKIAAILIKNGSFVTDSVGLLVLLDNLEVIWDELVSLSVEKNDEGEDSCGEKMLLLFLNSFNFKEIFKKAKHEDRKTIFNKIVNLSKRDQKNSFRVNDKKSILLRKLISILHEILKEECDELVDSWNFNKVEEEFQSIKITSQSNDKEDSLLSSPEQKDAADTDSEFSFSDDELSDTI